MEEKRISKIKKQHGQPTVPSIQGDSFQAPQQPRKPMMVTFKDTIFDADKNSSLDDTKVIAGRALMGLSELE